MAAVSKFADRDGVSPPDILSAYAPSGAEPWLGICSTLSY
jgi:hypothetical protein